MANRHCEQLTPRQELAVIAVVFVLCSFLGLAIYSTLPGSNPVFVLRDVTVYEFNATSPSSGPSYLNTSVQVTLSSRNPSGSIGIHYFTLGAYASYRGQQITPLIPMALPQAHQGCKEVLEWSPFLEGRMVPVSPGALAQDLAAGTVPIDVTIDGRVRWTGVAGRSRILHVNCPAPLMMNTSVFATGSGLPMELHSAQHCTVDLLTEKVDPPVDVHYVY